MKNKMNIKKGDKVVVLSGDDKGKKGTVLKAFPKKQRIIVENVNMMKKHERPSQKNPQGGISEIEAPIHVSNVKIINNRTKEVTKAVYKKIGDKRVRVCAKTGDEL